MRFLTHCFLTLFSLVARAQILTVIPGTTDPMTLRFNPEFIARNHITGMRSEAMVKRDGQPMRSKNESQQYRFDALGNTVWRCTAATRPNAVADTSSVFITYDAHGRAVEERRNDATGTFALRDSFSNDGVCLHETYVRIENLGPDHAHFLPGQETVISNEHFVHATLNDTADRTTWLNERGLPYREQTFHRDRFGYLRTIDDLYLITGRRGRISFRYSEKGRLFERAEQPDLSVNDITQHTWRYDAAGNVLYCDQARNGRAVRNTEYLYEAGTMLLKAVLAKDVETGLIHVTRYTATR